MTSRNKEYVLRHGYVVTMDRELGDIPNCDVHVRDREIVAVAPSIDAPLAMNIEAGSMIVMPGLIDTHRHLWNSTLRSVAPEGVEYFPLKKAFVEHYTVEDHYRSNRLALAEAIDSGITTIHNFAHNTRTSDHVDAELRAMAESGLRGRYSYGWCDPTPRDQVQPLEDINRVKEEWFGSNSPFDGRIDLGVAIRGPVYTPYEVYSAEFRNAISQGLPTTFHTGASRKHFNSVGKMHKEGFVQQSTMLSHWMGQTDEDFEALLDSGASVNLSPTSDLRTPGDSDLHDALFMLLESKVTVSISTDCASLSGASFFEQMALLWYLGVPWADTRTEQLPLLDFTTCLELATIRGAQAMGIDGVTGSLTPGKRADIILVRATDLNMAPVGDVRHALVRNATASNVDTVIVDGRILKRDRKLVGMDVEVIKREAAETLKNLRSRAGGSWISILEHDFVPN